MSSIFRTEWLIARRLQAGDLAWMRAVYGDADAMRWVGDGEPITDEACVKWLEVTENNFASSAMAMFALLNRRTGEVLGFCGLVHPGGQPETEIKHALKRSYRGTGLATEAVGAMLAYGTTEHRLAEVVATSALENVASHKVLLKAGMQRAALRVNEDGTFTQVFRWRPLTPPVGHLRVDGVA